MKRYISFFMVNALCCVALFGKNNPMDYVYVARSFGLSQQNREGTARSVAMGNAFTALGGDMGSISINPASSAVYRYSEFSITPSITNAGYNSTYAGGYSNSGNLTRFGISNAGFIGSFETGRSSRGLVRWSLGVVLNKQNNLTYSIGANGRNSNSSWLQSLAEQTNGIDSREMDINSHQDPFLTFGASDWVSVLGWNTTLLSLLPNTTDQYIAATENMYNRGVDSQGNQNVDIMVGGPLDQNFLKERRGSVTSATVNFGGNISNIFYFGINLEAKSVYEKINISIAENAVNSRDFDSGFESFGYGYEHKTFGTGLEIKAGFIFTPSPFFRLGGSIASPTYYWLTERYSSAMRSAFNDGYSQLIFTPEGEYDYTLQSPFSFSLGAAGVIPGIGVISADYEMIDYSSMRLREVGGRAGSFAFDNAGIKEIYKAQHIFRVGLELTPIKEMAVRAGFQHYSNPYKNPKFTELDTYIVSASRESTNIVSAGLGYNHSSGFFMDAAFQTTVGKDEKSGAIYDGPNAPIVNYKTNCWKLLFTFGFRF